MSDKEKILQIVLQQNIFEYILVNPGLQVCEMSSGVVKYIEGTIKEGVDITHVLPELVGYQKEMRQMFFNTTKSFHLESIHKGAFYIHLKVHALDHHYVMILLQNITDTILSKQKVLQYDNEKMLYSKLFKC